MAKLPYMQFYPADYLRDTRCLSMASRGAWMDILCALWHAPKRGQKTLSLEGWAGELGKPSAEVSLYLLDLELNQIGKFFHEKDERITISSRRMMRDERVRRAAAKRQQKQRDESESRTESRPRHSDVTGIYQKSDIRNQSQKSDLQNSDSEKEKRKKKSGDEGQPVAPAKSAETWEAYSTAYRIRYGVEPARNTKTNALLCQLVDRLGSIEAPSVAEFYLTHNSPMYVRCRHPPNLLVMNAEGLRTQWLTGNKATRSEVQQAELQDDASEQVKRVDALLARGL